MDAKTDLLIIGAGPFGLSLAAYASHLGIRHTIVGEPMGFWRRQMPRGMYLRSDSDWHLDAAGKATIDGYTASLGRTRKDVEPLSLEYYLGYAEWFQGQWGITADQRMIDRLEEGNGRFVATFEDGSRIAAERVAIAPGFRHFASVPEDIAGPLPAGRWGHTCDVVDLARFAGRRVMIVGGRQSAFEWAALLDEAGAASIDLSYRHETPAFAAADWSWVPPIVDAMVENPGWYRRLTEEEKTAVSRRLWAEGRLKLEPWLAPRLASERIRLWPGTRVVSCAAEGDGMRIGLDTEARVSVDYVIFATGYKPAIERVPMLRSLLDRIESRGGCPVLSERFETSVPGLYMTSFAAVQDFGPFFAFTVSARTSARIIGDSVAKSLDG
jgi:cation diffusion facilitator CzcD-associated flavoprotein CzcO